MLLLLGLAAGAFVAGGGHAPWARPAQPAAADLMARARLATVTVRVSVFRAASIDGSGFLIDGKGDVVTSANLLRRATVVKVIDTRGVSADASLIGLDPATDVAELLALSLAGRPAVMLGTAKVGARDHVLIPGAPAAGERARTAAVIGVGREATVNQRHYTGMLQLDTPAVPKSSGSPVLNEQGLAVAMRIADDPAADPRLAVPVMPVRSELAGWATHGAAVALGPPLVRAAPSALVLQADDVPAGFQVTTSSAISGRPTGVHPAWQVEYMKAPTNVAAGQALMSLAVVELSEASADSGYRTYLGDEAHAGFVRTDTTVALGDAAVLNVMHEASSSGSGTIDHFQVIWRDRNVVAIVELEAYAGDAGADDAVQLAARQEARMSADLAAY